MIGSMAREKTLIWRGGLRGLFLCVLVVMAAAWGPVAAAPETTETRLPEVMIDALEPSQWSVSQVIVAPGQVITVTNRDIAAHTFAVAAWDLDVALPTLVPIEVEVPEDAEPGSIVTFASTVIDDQEQGMEGTILVVTRDQVLAAARRQRTVSASVANRTTVAIDDSFTFTPDIVPIQPGAMLEIRNVGSIEHRFVVDEWHINETVIPGGVVLVQVPANARAGDSLPFYCSVPGHREFGMSGTLEIMEEEGAVGQISGPPERLVPVTADLGAFLPEPTIMGQGWSRVRTGTAEAILAGQVALNETVFPGEGTGAVYVGPEGSRATVVVMPLRTDRAPADQVKQAIQELQTAMVGAWTTDVLSSAAMQRIPPPAGCDLARRVSGIVPVTTLPAGATVCQLRAAGVAIFVAVEGGVGDESGVNGADAVIARVLSGTSIDEHGW